MVDQDRASFAKILTAECVAALTMYAASQSGPCGVKAQELKFVVIPALLRIELKDFVMPVDKYSSFSNIALLFKQ